MKRTSKLMVVLAAVVALSPIGPLSSGWAKPAFASGITGTEIITTIAGTGVGGFSGDGGPATSAQFSRPNGIALDAAGNLFIADDSNHRVRKIVLATGTITTVAGSGPTGGCPAGAGDGGPATSARLSLITEVAVDATGNLFVAEFGTSRIRMIDTSGIITTVAGIGATTPCEHGGFSGDGGLATSAQLNTPWGVAVDASGNLFIVDTTNHRIRKVAAGTGIITTVAGTGTAGFNGDNQPATSAQLNFPSRVAFDASGNLFITDEANHRIRKVVPEADGIITGAADEIITTVAGTGVAGYNGDNQPATSAQLYGPIGVAFDATGNLFIADPSNHRIRKVAAGTGIITTVAGTGTAGFNDDNQPATSAQLNFPYDVALDASGNLFISDAGNYRIRKVQAVIQVLIDIKPGSFPNSINPRGKGTIPVAILTTHSFDATTVDPTTVLFGPTGTEAVPVHSALEDVDGDGHSDLILHFNIRDTGIQCGHTSASLTGETFDGQMIEGSDSIKTAGCK